MIERWLNVEWTLIQRQINIDSIPLIDLHHARNSQIQWIFVDAQFCEPTLFLLLTLAINLTGNSIFFSRTNRFFFFFSSFEWRTLGCENEIFKGNKNKGGTEKYEWAHLVFLNYYFSKRSRKTIDFWMNFVEKRQNRNVLSSFAFIRNVWPESSESSVQAVSCKLSEYKFVAPGSTFHCKTFVAKTSAGSISTLKTNKNIYDTIFFCFSMTQQ